jgi:hypothetical protein
LLQAPILIFESKLIPSFHGNIYAQLIVCSTYSVFAALIPVSICEGILKIVHYKFELFYHDKNIPQNFLRGSTKTHSSPLGDTPDMQLTSLPPEMG